MKRREVAKLEVNVYEMGDVYHADVVHFGEVVHTTEGYIDWDSAKWAAMDWANTNLTKRREP